MVKNILVIGNGEVGKAIVKVEQESGNKVYIIDQKDKNVKSKISSYSSKKFDVCHICFPYSDNFVNICFNYLERIDTDLVIINSTVKPGTTEDIKSSLYYDIDIVHSPIRGVHPHLYEGVKTFVKYVGGDDTAVELACEHFDSLGIETQPVQDSKTSEMLKINCTSQYGYNILLAKMINEMCVKEKVSFKDVYTSSNKTYNEGYAKLGMANVSRPVLYPPEGTIKGHCVAPNFELLPDCTFKYFCKFINSYDLESKQKLIESIENDYFSKNRKSRSKKNNVSKSK